MASVTVNPVRTRREKRQFLELPWRIYRNDRNWVPPLRKTHRELVGYAKHPFYEHAEGQTFLAFRDGQPCGRVAAILDQYYVERYHERRGYFGFFECIDDQEAASGLFDAVRQWFAERDVVDMRGPINPSLNYECGLLVEGFDSPPMFMMTYNHPYYARLIEAYGFRKVQDLYAFWGHVDMLDTIDRKVYFVLDEATRRFGVKVRHLDRSRFEEDVRTFLRVYNEALSGTWGFTPLSPKEIDHMSADLKHLIVPELTSAADIDGKTVAACFALLDYNPRIKKINGRLFPFGFLRLLLRRRTIKAIRVISTNVIPEYQKWGLGIVIVSGLLPRVRAWGIKEAEFSWVLESNHLSCATLTRSGTKRTKTYRIYDYGPHEDPVLSRPSK